MTRLIDADTSIAKIKDLPVTYDSETVQRCIEVVSNAPTVDVSTVDVLTVGTKQHWIPCSEMLPDKDGDYLVTCVSYGWNCQEYNNIKVDAYYTHNGTNEYGDCLAYKGWQGGEKVIAWMPLPEVYEVEDEKTD